jgi:hypothetical protein
MSRGFIAAILVVVPFFLLPFQWWIGWSVLVIAAALLLPKRKEVERK